VVKALTNKLLIPWKLIIRWEKCLQFVSSINFLVTHVYREGNCCVDSLANIGLSLHGLTVWIEIPASIRGNVVKNRLGMTNYRFVNP